MFREAPELKKMITYEGRDVYLENNNPKVWLLVSSTNGKFIKFGQKIKLECDDTIIITFRTERGLSVSISNYYGLRIFNEKFYMLIDKSKVDTASELLYSLSENERNLVKKNIAALVAV